ncbi:MAG TPA: DUF11 domain-containing protein, partial [Chloroflexi bacterium]|nr:DUF11 domain-containing protein [Chloroflexota bacterium]
MLHLSLPRQTEKRRAQALVEFSLTILAFLLLFVLIIEVARILQAYITVQHAARMGARYATAGQWREEYSINPMYGWRPAQEPDDPLSYIRPCWPGFQDDPAGAQASTQNAMAAYEPYRNPRTCSVEEVVLRSLTGLNLDPTVSFPAAGPPPDDTQPNFYRITIFGVGQPVDPTEQFTRGCDPVGTNPSDRATYCPVSVTTSTYSTYGYTAPTETRTLIRGFAGDPQQKVIVQVEYRLPIITPILSNIVPSIRITGTAVMTNEAFGSTGLQREAILPPELPAVPTPGSIPPPDLVVSDFVFQGPNPPNVGQDTSFTVEVTNQGEETANNFTVKLYGFRNTDPNGGDPTTPLDLTGAIELGSQTVTQLVGKTSVTLTFSGVQFPFEGSYTVYAWADSDNTVDETGTGSVADPTREENNAALTGPILVSQSADISITKQVLDPTTRNVLTDLPTGGQVIYQVTITNTGPDDATSVEVQEPLSDPGLSYVSHTTTQGTYDPATGVWQLAGGLPYNQTATLEITASVTASAGSTVTNTATVTSVTPLDPNSSNDTSTLTLTVGAADAAVSINVNNNRPNVGDTVQYTITITNNSTQNTALAVHLETDVFPSSLSVDPASISPGSPTCGITSGKLICDLGDLGPGNNTNVTFNAQLVDANGGNPITVTAGISTTSP